MWQNVQTHFLKTQAEKGKQISRKLCQKVDLRGKNNIRIFIRYSYHDAF